MAAASATSDIILPKNFAVDRITYSNPKQLETGAKSIYISYNEKQLLVQTPDMTAPFGVSMWPGERGAPDKYNIDVSFTGRESRPQLQSFFDMLEAISERVITDAMENAQSWFKRRFPSRDVVEALYTPIIKYSKDRNTGEINTQYPPNFKMSLPFRDGQFQFPVYDGKRNPLNLLDIATSDTRGKGSRVSAIVQCSAVWIAASKFGVTWKVRQLRISEPARLTGYAFQKTEEEEDDEEGEELEVVAKYVVDPKPTPAVAAAAAIERDVVAEEAEHLLESSDEDAEKVNECDELDAVAPTPTRKASSSTVSRKPVTH
jgi:hypothetical protein